MRRRFLAVVAAAVVAISGLTIPAAYADTDPSPAPTSAEEAGLPLAPEEVTEPADHPTSGGAETTSEPASTPGQPDAEQAAPAEGESAPELTPAVEEPEPASSEEAMEEVPAEEPQIASLMATRADTEAPSIAVQGSGVELLVTRTATGTGHGTIAQCGINSNNPDVFPDGNQAGAPADDSPYDEYACGRDSIQYQVELNFGQDAIPAARTVTFSALRLRGRRGRVAQRSAGGCAAVAVH